jgi:hypothetical protein
MGSVTALAAPRSVRPQLCSNPRSLAPRLAGAKDLLTDATTGEQIGVSPRM